MKPWSKVPRTVLSDRRSQFGGKDQKRHSEGGKLGDVQRGRGNKEESAREGWDHRVWFRTQVNMTQMGSGGQAEWTGRMIVDKADAPTITNPERLAWGEGTFDLNIKGTGLHNDRLSTNS